MKKISNRTDIHIDHLVDMISTVDVGKGSHAFLIDSSGDIVTQYYGSYSKVQ